MPVRRDRAGPQAPGGSTRRRPAALDDEELRLLSNFETYTHKLLQIVLVGQPELQTRLRQQNLRQLQQRVSVRAIINPLDAAEMQAYIQHRLNQVGADERLFEPAALRAIVRHARGIPRRANILCHSALFAFGRAAGVTMAPPGEVSRRWTSVPGWPGRGTLHASPPSGWSWLVQSALYWAGRARSSRSGRLLGGDRNATRRPPWAAAATPAAAPAAPAVAGWLRRPWRRLPGRAGRRPR
jgi:hypothetical protein